MVTVGEGLRSGRPPGERSLYRISVETLESHIIKVTLGTESDLTDVMVLKMGAIGAGTCPEEDEQTERPRAGKSPKQQRRHCCTLVVPIISILNFQILLPSLTWQCSWMSPQFLIHLLRENRIR